MSAPLAFACRESAAEAQRRGAEEHAQRLAALQQEVRVLQQERSALLAALQPSTLPHHHVRRADAVHVTASVAASDSAAASGAAGGAAAAHAPFSALARLLPPPRVVDAAVPVVGGLASS